MEQSPSNIPDFEDIYLVFSRADDVEQLFTLGRPSSEEWEDHQPTLRALGVTYDEHRHGLFISDGSQFAQSINQLPQDYREESVIDEGLANVVLSSIFLLRDSQLSQLLPHLENYLGKTDASGDSNVDNAPSINPEVVAEGAPKTPTQEKAVAEFLLHIDEIAETGISASEDLRDISRFYKQGLLAEWAIAEHKSWLDYGHLFLFSEDPTEKFTLFVDQFGHFLNHVGQRNPPMAQFLCKRMQQNIQHYLASSIDTNQPGYRNSLGIYSQGILSVLLANFGASDTSLE